MTITQCAQHSSGCCVSLWGALASSQRCSCPASVFQPKANKPTLSLTGASCDFFLFCFWEPASGYISGCQRVGVQRHGAYGAPAWEGRKDSCSGSWHDQVGAEIPGGERDETVRFGCSCDRGCSEVNETIHSTGIIFFFQLNVEFPTEECCHTTFPWYLSLWSERLHKLLCASGAWQLFPGSCTIANN